MKNLCIILGIIVSLITFSFWFYTAYATWDVDLPNNGVPVYAIRVFYSGYFISSGLFAYVLSLQVNKSNFINKVVKFLCFAYSNFMGFLMFSYLLNWNFNIIVGLNKITFTLLLTFAVCGIYSLFFYRSL